MGTNFPEALADWSGHKSGGVRRMFDEGSGRPADRVVETRLLRLLSKWAAATAHGQANVPRLVLLVGGPGNGKTEAVEATVQELGRALGRGDLSQAIAAQFIPAKGEPVPRVVRVTLPRISADPLRLSIVQDASVRDAARPETDVPWLLVQELEHFLGEESGTYLACVNRGVLDDALIAAAESQKDQVRDLLESITKAVGLTGHDDACWPLSQNPAVAVWPMDVESLLVSHDETSAAPALTVLGIAVDESRWPVLGTCPAGMRCPFCQSRSRLSTPAAQGALLKLLRFHELGTGKRWSFRDLFSLIPQLLARVPEDAKGQTPCVWAAEMVSLDAERELKVERKRAVAIFQLATASYQHVLFGDWERAAARLLQNDLRDLRETKNPTMLGLVHFLRAPVHSGTPATLAPLILGLCRLLDPALAAPELEVRVSASKSFTLGDVDARFSQSVASGLEFIKKGRCLLPVEIELLQRLAEVDTSLNAPEIRSTKPAAARRVQYLLREFSCRMVRRSLGASLGLVQDERILAAFAQIVDSRKTSDDAVHRAAKSVEGLLNTNGRFLIPLGTTFGEPIPPKNRRVTLVASRQKVRPKPVEEVARPPSPVAFLTIGSGGLAQSVALTYDLFKAVKDIEEGLVQASLPTSVVALLDSTRAKLAGSMVRDATVVEDAVLVVGSARESITRGPRGEFVVQEAEDES